MHEMLVQLSDLAVRDVLEDHSLPGVMCEIYFTTLASIAKSVQSYRGNVDRPVLRLGVTEEFASRHGLELPALNISNTSCGTFVVTEEDGLFFTTRIKGRSREFHVETKDISVGECVVFVEGKGSIHLHVLVTSIVAGMISNIIPNTEYAEEDGDDNPDKDPTHIDSVVDNVVKVNFGDKGAN